LICEREIVCAAGMNSLLTSGRVVADWAMQFPACCVLVWGADFMFLTW
jgi:hypothetical protein